jgi:hypothetical protein
MSTTTPLKAARVWAKQHPDQNAILHVISWTRGGRGGWLTKRHDTNVYITGGLACYCEAHPGQQRSVLAPLA